jgi:hypothetical protein
MKPPKIALLAAISLLSLSGCALPPLNFTPREVSQFSRKVDADLRSVSVTVAQDNEKKGAMDFTLDFSKTVPDLWRSGLEDSLNRSLAFSDSSGRKVNLRVKILAFDVPAIGITMRTDTIALYEVQNRESGEVIFSQEIISQGVVTPDYAFYGAKRAMESVNRAVQNNITEFLKVLQDRGLVKKLHK